MKLFYDDKMLDDLKRYVGWLVLYVDYCDNDEISLIEIIIC